MMKYMKGFVWGIILLAIIPASLAAQDYVYTNNDATSTAGNTVSAYVVDTNGALGLISTYTTGGVGTGGGLYSANRIIVVNDFLYASNAGSNNISVFTINPTSGALTLVGSPVATLGSNNPNESGISLAAAPGGKFLYAGTTDGNITSYSIDSTTGALTTVGSAVSAGAPMSSMKVTPNGKYLIVAIYNSNLVNVNQVAVFAIQSDGTLLAVTNSPFTLKSGNGYGTGVDVNCVLTIASNGQLTELANSPFSTAAASNQAVALSTDDNTLFSSNQSGNSVTVFSVASDGSLAVPGTTVSAGANSYLPGGLVVSKDGAFLYAANQNSYISTFGVGGSSPLSLDSDSTSTGDYGLHSLAAYPAKACASTSSTALTASLQITAGPPPGFGLSATLALDSSLVVDPLTQDVAIQIGTLSLDLPAGSLTLHQSGANAGTYVFQGSINGINLKLQISPLGQNQFQISAYGKQVDLTGLANPVTVTVGLGGNSTSTSVTANLASSLSNSSFVQAQ
ncbi:MAG: beta-propeller fold lactonase family protein [Acidobacteriota bacterium]